MRLSLPHVPGEGETQGESEGERGLSGALTPDPNSKSWDRDESQLKGGVQGVCEGWRCWERGRTEKIVHGCLGS